MTYRELIRNPRCVCNDWLYGFLQRFPGHPAVWATLFAVTPPLVTALLGDIVAPIHHFRSPNEKFSPYVAGPLIIMQVVVMPLIFQAAVQCFDQLRPALPANAELVAQLRRTLINPSQTFQRWLLGCGIVLLLAVQELSSSRFSRFINGDWNGLDIWLTLAGVFSGVMFLWFLILPLSRTLVLARIIERHFQPELFNETLGQPVGRFGYHAGLVFAIPYAICNCAAIIFLNGTWTIVIPPIIGLVMALSFVLIPGLKLREKMREIKTAELAWLRVAITECHRNLDKNAHEIKPLDKLVNLVNYRRQVSEVSEWPFDAKLIRGFGLYFLLIPLTWVASALVELVIEQMASAI